MQEFACIPTAAVHINSSAVSVRVLFLGNLYE